MSGGMAQRRKSLHGIAHAHSTRSFDGRLTYAELRATFRGAGLDFACMTEHIEQLTQTDIDAIIGDCRAHSDAEFLFIPGIEMDCFTIYFLGLAPVVVDFRDNRSIFDSLRPRARLCVLSHPIKARYRYPDWVIRQCDAVEILNTKHDGRFFFRPQSERLLARIRRARPEVVPVVGMDFHDRDQLTTIHMRLTEPGPLDPDFVLEQLRQGRVDFFDGDQRMRDVGLVRRSYCRARIQAMDAAHASNRWLRDRGIKLPRVVRRALSRTLEGG
jgi:hypothetical protein